MTNFLHRYVYFLLFLKLGILFFILRHLYFRVDIAYSSSGAKSSSSSTVKVATTKMDQSETIKKQLEVVFTIFMSLLIIYIFYPFAKPVEIDQEMRVLLFSFGIVVLLSNDWYQFISNDMLLLWKDL